MAVVHGKEGIVKAGGTQIGNLTGFTLETSADVVEKTALDDATKSFTVGRTSFSGNLDMNFDRESAQQVSLLAGSSIAFIVYPEGATSGDRTYTGTGIVTGMSTTNAMDGIVSRAVTFQGTGALAISTV